MLPPSISCLWLGGGSISIEIEGKPSRLPNGDASQLRRISSDYFRTLSVLLLKGRGIFLRLIVRNPVL